MSLGLLGLGGCSLDKKEGTRKKAQSKPPNIVLILADDMGYGDIQAFNSESRIPTPHLNRLAGEGIRFTDAHSGSAVCSPTRYGLLTGRYCWRTELKKGVLWPPDDKPLIGPERLTIAGLLKQKGYSTACFGKWHVGLEWGRNESGDVDFNKPLQYGPRDVGFDESFIIAGSLDMVPYAYYHNHIPTQPVTEEQPGLSFPKFIRQGPRASDFDPEKVLDRLTEQAVKYITSRSSEESPFFLYLPLTAPHKPVWPAERFKDKTELGPYGDFIHQTDWSVGQVLQAIRDNGIFDNTLVIFTSDNGSYMYRWPEDQADHLQDPGIQGYHPSYHQSNAVWRGTKADVWEGGHRVPFIIRWPGKVDPGSSCDKTICLTDVIATSAEIANTSLPESAAEDSFSLIPLLENNKGDHTRAPVIHHSSGGIFSLREGDWKMVFGSGSGGRQKPVGRPFEEPFFLFNLKEDPREQKNVILEYPDVAKQLTIKLENIINSAGSRFVQND